MWVKSQIKFWNDMTKLLIMFLLPLKLWGFTVTTFSPQGEIARINDKLQVTIVFSEAMVALGKTDAKAPLHFSCALQGNGRWVDERTWVFDITKDLAPHTICHAILEKKLKSSSGQVLEGPSRYTFFTGAPKIVRTWPGRYERIVEDQVFVLEYDSRVSQKLPIFFQIEGFPERLLAVRLNDKEREVLLKALRLEKRADNIEMVRSPRRFPAGKKFQLLWGEKPEKLHTILFEVQPAFKATLNCSREHVNADCLPLQPIELNFTSSLPREMAEKIRLRTPLGERKPTFSGEGNQTVQRVVFTPPFPLLSDLSLFLPENLKDDSGRSLLNQKSFPLEFKTADAPALVKFAAAPFGIIESGKEAFVPLTVRNVETDLSYEALS